MAPVNAHIKSKYHKFETWARQKVDAGCKYYVYQITASSKEEAIQKIEDEGGEIENKNNIWQTK